jgi:hypothetical protein
LGIRFPLPAGERSGLPFSGTLRCFQILAQPLVLFAQPLPLIPQALALFLEPLNLFLQMLILFFKPLVLFLELLVLLPGLLSLPPRTAQFLRKFPNTPDRIEILEKQIILWPKLKSLSSFFSGPLPKACIY